MTIAEGYQRRLGPISFDLRMVQPLQRLVNVIVTMHNGDPESDGDECFEYVAAWSRTAEHIPLATSSDPCGRRWPLWLAS